jgi:pantetheine-phosphate adenylyltransferase
MTTTRTRTQTRRAQRIALYAGTFDPITWGHLSVVDRGAQLFDRLWVVVAVNPTKDPFFSVEERLQMIREETARWPNVACTSTAGYVVDLARSHGARFLLRGVRSCTDVEGEIALANMNHELAPEVETIFIPAHPELSEVSSSTLKELFRQGMDIARYCPPKVEARLAQRLLSETLQKTEACHA